MADEQYTFTQARGRLEDIVVQVRKKDVSLEHSLDLLEEGVRLASVCTELIDHTEWRAAAEELAAGEAAQGEALTEEGAPLEAAAADATDAPAGEPSETEEAEETP